jgi:hypothetical protein
MHVATIKIVTSRSIEYLSLTLVPQYVGFINVLNMALSIVAGETNLTCNLFILLSSRRRRRRRRRLHE